MTFCEINVGHKKRPTHKSESPGINMQYFPFLNLFARCTKCKGLLLAQNYSCQLCIILATGCHNLGRLNNKLFEVFRPAILLVCVHPVRLHV